MRILVTGAAGFVGRSLITHLLRRPDVEEILALDVVEAAFTDPRVRVLRGDVAEIGRLMPAQSFLSRSPHPVSSAANEDPSPRHAEESRGAARLEARTNVVRPSRRPSGPPQDDETGSFRRGTQRGDAPPPAPPDTVFHIAGITTQACEADPDLAFAVNVEGTRALLAWCRTLPTRPRFVFTSSVAVFGDGTSRVDEASRVAPATTYGATKVMAETLVADATRRGDIAGATLRLPVTVIRPGRSGRPGAGYMSDLIRAVVSGRAFVAPLPAERVVPIASIASTVALLERQGFAADPPALLHVPAIAASGEAVLAALAAHGHRPAKGQIAFEPDPGIEKLIAGWPALFESREATPGPSLMALIGAYRAAP